MKLAVLSLMLVLVALTGFSTSAGASSSSGSGNEAADSFCGVARGVAHDIVNSTAIANGHLVPGKVKVIYEKIAAAEPALLSSASGPIKADLRPVFGFVNLLIVDFKKVNWNPAGLAPYMSTLVPRARAIQKPLNALEVYFKNTCKIKI